MALSKIDVANMLTGATPVANGGTALTSGFQNGVDPRPSTVPIIQNGDMAVSQRATSVTGITDDGYKLCDRWYEYLSSLGTYTFAQEAQTSGNAFNNGFRTAFRIDCTTADASPSASDEFWWGIKLEGQDLQMFKKGSSNAEKFTLAFWVKSNKTGVGQVNFRDTDNSRMCSGTYTISSANTWEHKIINIAADTTGAFTNDNAESLQIQWYLDSGSNYEGGATPTAWEADSAGDRNASGNLNIGDNTANDWSITGIQLEVGEYTSSTLPPFQHESFGNNLARCQRYYTLLADNTSDLVGMTAAYNGTTSYSIIRFPTEMRSDAVSVEQASGSNYYSHLGGNANAQFNSFTVEQTRSSSMRVSADTSKTQGDAGWFELAANGRLAVEDEL
jgi:hypothetical protein